MAIWNLSHAGRSRVKGKKIKIEEKSKPPNELYQHYNENHSINSIANENNSPHPKLILIGEDFFILFIKSYICVGDNFPSAFDKYFKFFWVCDIEYPKEFLIFFAIFDSFIYKTGHKYYNQGVEKIYKSIKL